MSSGLLGANRAELRDIVNLERERPGTQGGGSYTRVAPAVRRARRRKASVAARKARKGSRR